MRDPAAAELPPRGTAIVHYVVKLTRTPAAVTANDLTPMREAGLDDRSIHDVCAVASYYGFVNRLANGLGVELE